MSSRKRHSASHCIFGPDGDDAAQAAGALTAVAGLLTIKAGIAGSAVTTSTDAHVMGYALLLRASQQGITGLVDRQAQKVLNGISSKDNA